MKWKFFKYKKITLIIWKKAYSKLVRVNKIKIIKYKAKQVSYKKNIKRYHVSCVRIIE